MRANFWRTGCTVNRTFGLVMAALCGLTACGSAESPPASSDPAHSATVDPAPAAKSSDAVVVRVVANAPPGSPWDQQWQRFRSNIEGAPDAELTVELLTTGQAGNPDAAMASVRRGRNPVGGFPLAGAAAVIPELTMILAPYQFSSYEEADYVLDQHLLAPFNALFEAQGLKLLQWMESGYNVLYSQQPMLKPDDFRGYKMRSQPTEASRLFLSSIGADVIPLGFQDVVPSLQTGMIQGGESVIPIYVAAGVAAQAKHVLLTRHAFDAGVIVANKDWYEALSERQREVLLSAIGSPATVREEVRTMEGQMLKDGMKNGSLIVQDLTVEQRAVWQAATAGERDKLLESVGGRAAEVASAIDFGKNAFLNLPKIGPVENPTE
jgi:TRAP-type transport system periplasmic protein